MLRTFSGVALAVALLALCPRSAGHEKEKKHDATAVHRPDDLKWQDGPPSLPPGAKIAVLEGDPSKEGPFVFRVKVPAGMKHFVWVKGETVVQFHGDGPWVIEYVNAADDPRKRKK